MATRPAPSLLVPSAVAPPAADAAALAAADVARGVGRLLLRHDFVSICEVPLPNGRRADVMAVDGRGRIAIVEIKVSRADLLGDGKWRDYLDYCDMFYWAVPAGFALDPFADPAFAPDLAGLIVADRYDAAIAAAAAEASLAAPRRKAATLAFARRAARRLLGHLDPECDFGR
jgi:hypothetical protein